MLVHGIDAECSISFSRKETNAGRLCLAAEVASHLSEHLLGERHDGAVKLFCAHALSSDQRLLAGQDRLRATSSLARPYFLSSVAAGHTLCCIMRPAG